jgi:hypothetical protein
VGQKTSKAKIDPDTEKLTLPPRSALLGPGQSFLLKPALVLLLVDSYLAEVPGMLSVASPFSKRHLNGSVRPDDLP